MSSTLHKDINVVITLHKDINLVSVLHSFVIFPSIYVFGNFFQAQFDSKSFRIFPMFIWIFFQCVCTSKLHLEFHQNFQASFRVFRFFWMIIPEPVRSIQNILNDKSKLVWNILTLLNEFFSELIQNSFQICWMKHGIPNYFFK